MNFSDFDIEDVLNSPNSNVASNNSQARSLEENSDLEQDGKYFPYFYSLIFVVAFCVDSENGDIDPAEISEGIIFTPMMLRHSLQMKPGPKWEKEQNYAV